MSYPICFKSNIKHEFLTGIQLLTGVRIVDQFVPEMNQKKHKDVGYKSLEAVFQKHLASHAQQPCKNSLNTYV